MCEDEGSEWKGMSPVRVTHGNSEGTHRNPWLCHNLPRCRRPHLQEKQNLLFQSVISIPREQQQQQWEVGIHPRVQVMDELTKHLHSPALAA